MAEVGGYRQPSNPAPVSGPGALSKRTDGQPARYMSGGPYGEGQELMELQTSAPMASAPRQSVRPSRGRAPQGGDSAGVPVTPLFAPTERPDEPLTAGAPFGPGPNPSRPRMPGRSFASTLEKLLPYDSNGAIARMYQTAMRRGW